MGGRHLKLNNGKQDWYHSMAATSEITRTNFFNAFFFSIGCVSEIHICGSRMTYRVDTLK